MSCKTAQGSDPRVAQAERRLEVIRTRIAAERQKLGFDGQHGWFWRNRDSKPVTVTVEVKGDYADLSQVD